MTSPSEGRGFGARLATAFKRLLVTTLVLGLAGVSVFLLSQLNARTFTLEVRDGKLVVLKGRLMPMGADPFRPNDPALVDAYAPLDLKNTQPYGVLNLKFTERDELDRALFSVIEGLARPRVASDDPKELEDGLYYLRRADRLSGLTDEQRLSLKQMKADVAFYSARTRLEEGQRLIEEAIAQLLIAASSPNKHTREANQMLVSVQGESKTLIEALRRAVHSLSAPAEPAATTTPAPASAPTADKPTAAPVAPAPRDKAE